MSNKTVELTGFDKDVLKAVLLVKEKPVGYIGAKSITRLKCFLDGFCFGYNYPSTGSFFPAFQERIEAKYRWKYNDSWAAILLKITNDEEKAFDLFYKEFQCFLEENTIAD